MAETATHTPTYRMGTTTTAGQLQVWTDERNAAGALTARDRLVLSEALEVLDRHARAGR